MDDKTFLNLEKAAEGLLREFAKKSGGAFPKKLDDLDEFSKLFPKQEKQGTLPAPETLQAVQSLTRFLMASKNMKGVINPMAPCSATPIKSSSGIDPRAQPNTGPFTATCTRAT
jgi:hypothetical protein